MQQEFHHKNTQHLIYEKLPGQSCSLNVLSFLNMFLSSKTPGGRHFLKGTCFPIFFNNMYSKKRRFTMTNTCSPQFSYWLCCNIFLLGSLFPVGSSLQLVSKRSRLIFNCTFLFSVINENFGLVSQ